MRGLGIDRHLFGLYIVAKGMKMDPLPKIFQDKVDLVLQLFRAYSGYLICVSISLWEFIWGVNTRRYTLVHSFYFF